MLKLNLRIAALGICLPLAMVAGACAHHPAGPVAAEDQKDVAAETAEPEKPVSSADLNEQAIAEWEAYKAEHPWEERLAAFGLDEDPGLDPDPEKVWVRDGGRYTIEKFDKRMAVFLGAPIGYVRPYRGVGVQAEIYRDDDEHMWVWLPAVESIDPEKRALMEKYRIRDLSPERKQEFVELSREFTVLTPRDSGKVIRFVESSEGLPREGSWRNSLTVADMNGDGHADIVAPPQRGSFFRNQPTIFLGDGTGNWTAWREVRWPAKPIDYGSVRAADFNRDGNMDLAFAVHLRGVSVYLGDGNGTFIDASQGLPADSFPTRRIEIADVDADGDSDIIALSEGPELDISKARVEEPKVRMFVNDGTGRKWEEYEIGEAKRYFGGDWLAVGNFNGDKFPDYVAASHAFHGRDVMWLSEGDMEWSAFGRGFLPRYSYVGAVATGKITSSDRDAAIISFTRYWPGSVNPEEVAHPEFDEVSGIELVSFAGAEPVRTPVIRWDSNRPTWAMASGDINGDGFEDIVYARKEPAENGVLLADGRGGFLRAEVEGWDFVDNTAYDLTLADVDADGKLDLLIMFENNSKRMNVKDGSIRVYLNRTE